MDVKTVFLNDELKVKIYMTQPKGCVVPSHENKVCKLLKSWLKYLFGPNFRQVF